MLDKETVYTQVSAGQSQITVLLASDGRAVVCGGTGDAKCHIPQLEVGMSYTQVSAGGSHTLLLRSDGNVVACGSNDEGQCNIPLLEQGLSYSQVAAGANHTILLRSDSRAVAVGDNEEGQCNIPNLDPGTHYIVDSRPVGNDLILQLDLVCEDESFMLPRFAQSQSFSLCRRGWICQHTRTYVGTYIYIYIYIYTHTLFVNLLLPFWGPWKSKQCCQCCPPGWHALGWLVMKYCVYAQPLQL